MRQPLGDYDEHYDQEFELVGEHRPEEEYARPPRRLPSIVLSLVAMVVFAGGLWFAYHLGAKHSAAPVAANGDVPLIRADQKPDKIKPDQPGGMQIPDQNVSLYNDKPGVAPVEKLLPPPEKPMPRPAPEPRQAALPPPAPAAPAPEAAPPAAAAAKPQTHPAASAKPAPQAKSALEAKPAAEPKSTAAAEKSGPVQIRLASVRTPDEARAEWARIKHDNADLLGSITARAVRADLGDKGIYYRVEAGPFDSAAAAARACTELKRRGLGCILAR